MHKKHHEILGAWFLCSLGSNARSNTSTRSVEVFLKSTAIASHPHSRKSAKFWQYATAGPFKNAPTFYQSSRTEPIIIIAVMDSTFVMPLPLENGLLLHS